jgi:hypothetical protein
MKIRNRAQKLVIVHCHPTKGVQHQTVMKILRDMEITREEFEAWLKGGKKAKARRPPSA